MGGLIVGNNYYLYRGKYVEMDPIPIKTEYLHIITRRKFFGFKLDDKRKLISEQEFIECSECDLYNYKFIKTFNDGDLFDRIGIFSLLTGGVPCVYKKTKYLLKYVFENTEDFELDTTQNIPAELCEYLTWGSNKQKEFKKLLGEKNNRRGLING